VLDEANRATASEQARAAGPPGLVDGG
jgi:hypothetical protein